MNFSLRPPTAAWLPGAGLTHGKEAAEGSMVSCGRPPVGQWRGSTGGWSHNLDSNYSGSWQQSQARVTFNDILSPAQQQSVTFK